MIPSSLISIEMQSAGSRGIGGKGHMNVNDGIYNPITQTVVPARNARRGASISFGQGQKGVQSMNVSVERDNTAQQNSILDNSMITRNYSTNKQVIGTARKDDGDEKYSIDRNRDSIGSRSQDRANEIGQYLNAANNEYDDFTSGIKKSNHTRNASAFTQSRQLPILGQNSRPLPVHEKEGVFNEWGAVIKHQDEIDREMKRLQDEKLRERQK